MLWRNTLLLLGVVVLSALPLIVHPTTPSDELFAGADTLGRDAVTQIQPSYRPWARPLWEPPSGEIESLLFALQAGLGAGLLGYFFGYKRGQAQADA